MKHFKSVLRVPTCLILIVGFSIFSSCNSSKQDDLGTYENPEIALKETQKALSLLSKHVNTGYKSVHVIEEYEITKDKIFNLN
jgi:hypothetical protein